MNFVTRLLRTILAVDTVSGAIILPFMIGGCLLSGNLFAAMMFTAIGVLGAVIYGRYWRRFPLGQFPEA